jgi:hypothetical protein
VRVGSRRVRVRRSDLDLFLAGSATRAVTEDTEPIECDARADLGQALDRARDAVDLEDARLSLALRELARVAERIAERLEMD